MTDIRLIGERSKAAGKVLAKVGSAAKNAALYVARTAKKVRECIYIPGKRVCLSRVPNGQV